MKKVKKKYIVIFAAALGYYLWTMPPAEVREILRNSELVQEQFIHRWSAVDRKKAIKGVYLSDVITAVNWDRVCLVGEYHALVRERVLSKGGGNFEVLDYWGRISENYYMLIFINKAKVVGVIENDIGDFHYFIDFLFNGCSTKEKAKIKMLNNEGVE